MKSFVLLTVSLGLLLAAAGREARAQYSTAPIPSWYDYGVMRQQTLNGWSVKDKMKRRSQAPRQPAPSPRPTTTTPPKKQPGTAPGGSTTFTPVAGSIMPQRLAEMTPAHREEAERFFSNVLETYYKIAREKGAPLYDVARAASFIIGTLYDVHRGNTGTADPERTEGLRRQMYEIFSADEEFQRLPARRKQEIYESFIIQGMYVSAVYIGSVKENDRQKMGEMQAIARRNLEQMLGVPAGRIRLTNRGVEFR